MPRTKKTKLPPVPQSPVNLRSETYENRWIMPEGSTTSLQYMLSPQDARKVDTMSREPGHGGRRVLLYTLAPGNDKYMTRTVWYLVSFPAYVRPASCGASCFCALEWSSEPWQ